MSSGKELGILRAALITSNSKRRRSWVVQQTQELRHRSWGKQQRCALRSSQCGSASMSCSGALGQA